MEVTFNLYTFISCWRFWSADKVPLLGEGSVDLKLSYNYSGEFQEVNTSVVT